MKKIVAILLSLFVCTTAVAQNINSIVIDSNSFREVQTDALTGVNIDPIGVDHSRQKCARIKIKFDRMSKAQIDALEVKMCSNTDLTKQKVADYFDNVLVLEMTAKPNTRFYFYSPEFGESNEVTLNLDGNQEYEMFASLNQTYSIVVESNVVGATIYIDGVFKGQTDNNKKCTISDVMIGGHELKVVYEKVSSEKSIDVNKNSILFISNVPVIKQQSNISSHNAVKKKTIKNSTNPLVTFGLDGSIDGLKSISLGFGVLLRVGRYNSLFNGIVGCRYLYTGYKKSVHYFYFDDAVFDSNLFEGEADYKHRQHKLTFPVAINCNIIRNRYPLVGHNYTCYVGVGYEFEIFMSEYQKFVNTSTTFNEKDLYNSGDYDDLINAQFPSRPVVIQFGCAGRHWDWKVYCKFFLKNSNYVDGKLGVYGTAFTYYF